MNNIESKSNRYFPIAVLAVIVAGLFLGFGTVKLSPLNNHECLVTVTARQMVNDGDWVLPKFNDEPRLQKTPLMYWMVGAVSMITGQIDELTGRTPSIFLAVLTAIAILYFVNQWLDFKTALLASGIWVSTIAFTKYAQSARPEMALCSFVAIAMMAFYEGLRVEDKKRSKIFMLIFWVSFSLAMLAKGPAPLVLILPSIFCYFVFFKQWKKFGKTMPIIGSIIFIAAVLPWFLAVAAKVSGGWNFWKIEFIDRFMGEYVPGHKPIWYYAIVILSLTAPLSPLVIHSIASPFYKIWGQKRQTMWYVWFWMVGQIVMMTISGGKRQHYILSAVPGFSILAGIVLKDMIFDHIAFKAKDAKGLFVGYFAVAVIGAGASLYWISKNMSEFLYPAIHTAVIIITMMTLAGILFAANKKTLGLISIFVGYCVTMIVVQIYFVGPMSYNNGSREFSKRIGQTVPDEDELIAYQYISARTLQYAGRNIPKNTNLEDTFQKYTNGAWIIAVGGYLDNLKKDGRFDGIYFEMKNAERRGAKNVNGALLKKP